MGNMLLKLAEVIEVENVYSAGDANALRVRALFFDEAPRVASDVPWAFPLIPKTFQSVPKVGEAVLILSDETENNQAQRFYIGPIIAQPQYNDLSPYKYASALLKSSLTNPLASISKFDMTRGAFPNPGDVAVVGRGNEDITLKYDSKAAISSVDIRAGIRGKADNNNDSSLIGNVIFNNIDPAYIQLKYKSGIATGEKKSANSIINMVADRINIMSNKDEKVSHNLHDKETLVNEAKMDEIMDSLHQVPMGDKLVELLKIMKGAIMHHVHPWAGMEQCGDWSGFIKKLDKYDIDSILSEYVRIS